MDSTYNAYAQARTSKRDRYKVYNVLDKGQAVRNYIQQWQDRLKSAFKWKNLPATVPQRALESLLQDEDGYAIFHKYKDNFYVDFGGLGGTDENANYEISKGIITNAPLNIETEVYFKNNLNHEQNAVLIRNVPDLLTCEELVFSRYAKLLSETDITLELALIQARAMILAIAEDDEQKKAYDVYIQSLIEGKPQALVNDTIVKGIQTQQYATSMHQALTDINENYQFLKASMMQDMGISANNNQKRESIMSSESELITNGLTTLIDTMMMCRKEACEEINEIFGLNIDVEFAGVWKRNILADGINADEEDGLKEEENNVKSMAEDRTEEETGSSETDDSASESENRDEERSNAEDGNEEVSEESVEEEKSETEIKIEIVADEVNIEDTDTISIEDAVKEEEDNEINEN